MCKPIVVEKQDFSVHCERNYVRCKSAKVLIVVLIWFVLVPRLCVSDQTKIKIQVEMYSELGGNNLSEFSPI